MMIPMWAPPLTPIGNIAISFIIAIIPIVTLMVLLIVVKLPSHEVTLISSIVTVIIAVTIYRMPIRLALSSYLYGVLYGLWPISWIVINAMILLNLAEEASSIKRLEEWMLRNILGGDIMRILFVAFLFGSLVEGIDGFGFPIAIASALLVRLGFSPLSSVLVALLANTITVPYASLGVPVLTLSIVTELDFHLLTTYVALQLIPFSLLIPLLMVVKTMGRKEVGKALDAILLSGLTLGIMVYLIARYVNPYLAGILGPMISMVVIALYNRLRYRRSRNIRRMSFSEALYGWLPWIYVVSLMIIFLMLDLTRIFTLKVEIPFLHRQIYIELYGRYYSAVYEWAPLAHGTIVLIATLLTAITFGIKVNRFMSIAHNTIRNLKGAILTIIMVVGMSFLMNYSGISITIGYALSSLKSIYPFMAVLIGWLGTFITGSCTGSNALFGNLQRISAEILGISPYVTTTANVTGGVLGKIVSLQSIAIGTSAVGLFGKEGEVMRELLPYSLALTLILSVLVFLQS